MACTTIDDLLAQEAGRFGPEIYSRIYARSIWASMVKRGAWPDEMGDALSILTYERSAPTTVTDWAAIDVSDNDGAQGGNCLPTPVTVAYGSTTRSVNLKRRVLESPDFCVTDLRFKFNLQQQLEKILKAIGGYTMIEWENRYRRDYSAIVQKKMVLNSAPYTTGYTETGTYAAACATSILTQGVLDWAGTRLRRDGAAESAMAMSDGRPLLCLVASEETINDLKTRNDDIRQDIRWGNPSDLLQRMGVSDQYRGFYYMVDPYPRRFTCNNGVYTEVAAFANTAATKGTKSILNSSWLTAEYEESFIFDPEVFHSLIPAPITNPSAGFQFDPVTYLGDWKWKNIPSRDCNPDGTIGFFRGTLGHGAMPVSPERGMGFIHLRCDPSPNLVTSCT